MALRGWSRVNLGTVPGHGEPSSPNRMVGAISGERYAENSKYCFTANLWCFKFGDWAITTEYGVQSSIN